MTLSKDYTGPVPLNNAGKAAAVSFSYFDFCIIFLRKCNKEKKINTIQSIHSESDNFNCLERLKLFRFHISISTYYYLIQLIAFIDQDLNVKPEKWKGSKLLANRKVLLVIPTPIHSTERNTTLLPFYVLIMSCNLTCQISSALILDVEFTWRLHFCDEIWNSFLFSKCHFLTRWL